MFPAPSDPHMCGSARRNMFRRGPAHMCAGRQEMTGPRLRCYAQCESLSPPGRFPVEYRKWAQAHFFYGGEQVSALQTDIETRLKDLEPDVEVLLAEVTSGATLRLFIDHPEGVTLGLCERVSGCLSDYRDRYTLEVSSPGEDRPLTRPV